MANVSIGKRMLGWLQRTLFADLKDPTKQQVGLEAYVDGESTWYGITRNPSTGVYEWTAKGGPGFAGGKLGKYWVAPAFVAPVTGGPRALYTTLEDAVAAFIADGHDNTHPEVITMFPGAYSPAGGALEIPAGCTVSDVARQVPAPGAALVGGVTIVGNLTVTGPGARAFAGLAITGATGAALAVTGGATDDIKVGLTACSLAAAAGSAASGLAWTVNTDGRLWAEDTTFAGDGIGTSLSTLSRTSLFQCTAADVNNSADGVHVGAGSIFEARECALGSVNVGAGAGAKFVVCAFRSSRGTGLTASAGATAQVLFPTVDNGSGGTFFNGPGTFQLVEATVLTNTARKGATAVLQQTYVQRLLVEDIGSNNGTASSVVDVYTCDPAGGTLVFKLPQASSNWAGRTVVVVNIAAAGNVNVTPDAADTIDRGIAGAVYAIAPGAGTTYSSRQFMWSDTRAQWVTIGH